MKALVANLAKDYLRLARECATALQEQFGVSDILEAVNSSRIPREGEFRAFGGGRYFVHGAGCRIEALEVEIDFDFGPDSTVPGFDQWKLYEFARDHGDAYHWLPERERFLALVQDLASQGSFRRLDSNPNPHLLCPE